MPQFSYRTAIIRWDVWEIQRSTAHRFSLAQPRLRRLTRRLLQQLKREFCQRRRCPDFTRDSAVDDRRRRYGREIDYYTEAAAGEVTLRVDEETGLSEQCGEKRWVTYVSTDNFSINQMQVLTIHWLQRSRLEEDPLIWQGNKVWETNWFFKISVCGERDAFVGEVVWWQIDIIITFRSDSEEMEFFFSWTTSWMLNHFEKHGKISVVFKGRIYVGSNSYWRWRNTHEVYTN